MYGKLLIQCNMVVKTGLHIGASGAFSAIGTVDSPVIRDARTGLPMVPGSSLKGKVRTLLARSLAADIEHMPDYDKDDEQIRSLFGSAQPPRCARLQFADCFLSNAEEMAAVGYTEVKTENGISRSTSVANPRQIERVNPGCRFRVNLVYDIRKEDEIEADLTLLAQGLKLLQLDYLGGYGTRGSGRVSFRNFSITAEPEEPGLDTDTLTALFEEVNSYELFPD